MPDDTRATLEDLRSLMVALEEAGMRVTGETADAIRSFNPRDKPDARVVILPDGYNGHSLRFYAEPVEVDGEIVKLRCAEPGKEHMTAWRSAAEVRTAMEDSACARKLQGTQYEDEEVIGLDENGFVQQWDGANGVPYTSGESLQQWGLHNLREHEVARVGVTLEAWKAAEMRIAVATAEFEAYHFPEGVYIKPQTGWSEEWNTTDPDHLKTSVLMGWVDREPWDDAEDFLVEFSVRFNPDGKVLDVDALQKGSYTFGKRGSVPAGADRKLPKDAVEDWVTLSDGVTMLPANTRIYQPCQDYMPSERRSSDVFLSLRNAKALYPSVPDGEWLTLRLGGFKGATIVDIAEPHKGLKIRANLEQAATADSEATRIAGLVLKGDDESVLDSVVHDECSALATGINSDGVEAQVKYLLANGWTEAMILKEAGIDRTPSTPSPGM